MRRSNEADIALLNDYCQIVVTFGGSIVVAPQQTFAILARTVRANGTEPTRFAVGVEFRSRL